MVTEEEIKNLEKYLELLRAIRDVQRELVELASLAQPQFAPIYPWYVPPQPVFVPQSPMFPYGPLSPTVIPWRLPEIWC